MVAIVQGNCIRRNDIVMRLCKIDDAEFIISLRTDSILKRHISHTDNDLNKQKKWIKLYKKREKHNQEFYFIIEDENEKRWGTYRIYDLTQNHFTIGSWLCKRNAPKNIAIKADIFMKDFGYEHLKYNLCRFEVRKNNRKVLKYHKLFEPKLINEDELNYYFEIDTEKYYKNRDKICILFGIKT